MVVLFHKDTVEVYKNILFNGIKYTIKGMKVEGNKKRNLINLG
jgi:hypothetical protein